MTEQDLVGFLFFVFALTFGFLTADSIAEGIWWVVMLVGMFVALAGPAALHRLLWPLMQCHDRRHRRGR